MFAAPSSVSRLFGTSFSSLVSPAFYLGEENGFTYEHYLGFVEFSVLQAREVGILSLNCCFVVPLDLGAACSQSLECVCAHTCVYIHIYIYNACVDALEICKKFTHGCQPSVVNCRNA